MSRLGAHGIKTVSTRARGILRRRPRQHRASALVGYRAAAVRPNAHRQLVGRHVRVVALVSRCVPCVCRVCVVCVSCVCRVRVVCVSCARSAV